MAVIISKQLPKSDHQEALLDTVLLGRNPPKKKKRRGDANDEDDPSSSPRTRSGVSSSRQIGGVPVSKKYVPPPVKAVAERQIIRGERYGVVGDVWMICSARVLMSEYLSGSRVATSKNWESGLDPDWVAGLRKLAKQEDLDDGEAKYFECSTPNCSNIL